jgi:hypothetical protein
MKIQSILRTQAIVVGIGAALLLASVGHAQEIDNTQWYDGPNVAPYAQAVPVQPANELNLTVAQPNDSIPSVHSAAPIITQKAEISNWTPEEGWLFASFLICMGLVRLYAMAKSKRSGRNFNGRTGQLNGWIALS